VERALNTAGASLVTLQPDWRSRLLAAIADPSIAYLLMLAGVFGLFFELSNPDSCCREWSVRFRCCSRCSRFQMLPVNYAGLGLIALGLAFMTARPSYPVLACSHRRRDRIPNRLGDADRYRRAWIWNFVDVIVPVALISALFIFMLAGMALKARRRPVVSAPRS